MRKRIRSSAVLFFFFILCMVIGLAGCGEKRPLYYDIPRKVKVKVEGGIYVRQKPETQSNQSSIVGTALTGVTYTVLDARPAFYLISLPDEKKGWISTNPEENWTIRVDENLVKVIHEGGIAVRQKPYDKESTQVGVAAQGYVFDISDTEYSHLKILLPNGKRGWIFVGRPGARYVEEYYLP